MSARFIAYWPQAEDSEGIWCALSDPESLSCDSSRSERDGLGPQVCGRARTFAIGQLNAVSAVSLRRGRLEIIIIATLSSILLAEVGL